MATDDDFQEIMDTLEGVMDLPLTASQRSSLKKLCLEIAGVPNDKGATVPSSRLKQEADAKRRAIARAESAEKRVAELEAELEAEKRERRTIWTWWRR
jgi:hypothetical protein